MAAALVAVIATAASALYMAGADTHEQAPLHAQPGSAFEREMHESMDRMMAAMHAPCCSGNVDADFLAMMIPHHAGAVDMARLVLEHGRDPATRQLAEEIIAGQTVEIGSMRRRLETLRTSSSPPTAEFPALGGTRGP